MVNGVVLLRRGAIQKWVAIVAVAVVYQHGSGGTISGTERGLPWMSGCLCLVGRVERTRATEVIVQ